MQAGGTTVNLVFAREDGLPYHRNQASDALDRAITKAGLTKRLTPHGLRHTFASLLLAADGKTKSRDPAEVAMILGHKDSYVTLKVYTHFVKKQSTATLGPGHQVSWRGFENVSTDSIASLYVRSSEIWRVAT